MALINETQFRTYIMLPLSEQAAITTLERAGKACVDTLGKEGFLGKNKFTVIPYINKPNKQMHVTLGSYATPTPEQAEVINDIIKTQVLPRFKPFTIKPFRAQGQLELFEGEAVEGRKPKEFFVCPIMVANQLTNSDHHVLKKMNAEIADIVAKNGGTPLHANDDFHPHISIAEVVSNYDELIKVKDLGFSLPSVGFLKTQVDPALVKFSDTLEFRPVAQRIDAVAQSIFHQALQPIPVAPQPILPPPYSSSTTTQNTFFTNYVASPPLPPAYPNKQKTASRPEEEELSAPVCKKKKETVVQSSSSSSTISQELANVLSCIEKTDSIVECCYEGIVYQQRMAKQSLESLRLTLVSNQLSPKKLNELFQELSSFHSLLLDNYNQGEGHQNVLEAVRIGIENIASNNQLVLKQILK